MNERRNNDRRGGGGRQGDRRDGKGRGPGRQGGRGGGSRGRDRGRGRRDGRPPQRPRPRNEPGRLDTPRKVVLPGDVLAEGKTKGGDGTYTESGVVYAAQLGVKATYTDMVSVIPLGGRYVPMEGDEVIGKIVDVGPTSWMVDINSPYVGPLYSDETPWDVSYGEAGRFLCVGDLVLARVDNVDALKRVRISMSGWGLKKLNGGHMVQVSHSKVPRIIGKGGSMIKQLKDRTGCRIQVGQNGRIWLDGDPKMILVAVEAIDMIEKNAHTMGLTEGVGRFLDERLGLDVTRPRKERTDVQKEDDFAKEED